MIAAIPKYRATGFDPTMRPMDRRVDVQRHDNAGVS
jgi:hypothetical protein